MFTPLAFPLFLGMLQIVSAGDTDGLFNYTKIFGYTPRQNKDFVELAQYDGRQVKTYNVTTSDGYVLSLFRLVLKSECPPNATRLPIFCMHGLYLSSPDFIVAGPGVAHAYVLGDLCYDVWLGNNRGNRYSRRHVSLDPDKDPEFWDFAFDEMALRDLPAMIDTILKETGASQINYLAHSQGITILLILLAQMPEYNAVIKYAFGMSVASALKYSRLVVLPVEGALSALFGNFNSANNFEVFPYGGFTQKGVQYLCGLSTLEYPLCSVLIFLVFGYDGFQITDDILRVVVTNTPAGTSYKDFLRWGDVKNHGFCKKNYGLLKNIKEYGQPTPPLFDLGNITAQLVFFEAERDYVADPRDVHSLITEYNLTNATVECMIPDKTFGHLDFIYSKNSTVYITPHMVSMIETGTCNCTRAVHTSTET